MTATTTNADIHFISFLKCPMIAGEKLQFLFNEYRKTKLKAYGNLWTVKLKPVYTRLLSRRPAGLNVVVAVVKKCDNFNSCCCCKKYITSIYA